MPTHNLTWTYADQSSVTLKRTIPVTGNTEDNLHDAALAVAANHQYLRTYTRANLLSLAFSASGPVTIYTNNPSGSSPQDTIPLTAGQVLMWSLTVDGLANCPFSNNVTTIYVTNAGAAAVSFDIRAILNQ